jgi:DNA-binding NarL/FixJ family response regulator
VDDHPIISELLAVNLETEGMEVKVADSLAPDDVLAQAAEFRPGVVVLDLDLQGTLSVPLIAPLRAGGAAVVVLTGMKDKAVLGRCLEAGAAGVLSKESDFDRLRQAVLDAAEGRPVISERERVDLLEASADAARQERDRPRSAR